MSDAENQGRDWEEIVGESGSFDGHKSRELMFVRAGQKNSPKIWA